LTEQPPTDTELAPALLSDVAFSWKETGYRFMRKLGKGGASSVYLMMATSGAFKGKLFAVKFFTTIERSDWQNSFMKEIHFLRSCTHPAIIRVYDEGLYREKFPFVVMEYMECSLADVLAHQKSLSTEASIELIVQILSALNYLSRQDPPGVHRDIKPANILRQGNNWVLGDFGLVYLLHSLEKPANWQAPKILPMAQGYRTPEIVPFVKEGIPLPPASDVFQLGLVATQLFTGTNPLKAKGGRKRVELNEIGDVPGSYSETIKALLNDMLILSTTDRIDAATALSRWQELYLSSFRPASNTRQFLATTSLPRESEAPTGSTRERRATNFPQIGILAFGSLISDPQREIQSATAETRKVKTPFPVEFARTSKSRGGAPTLAPVSSDGAHVDAVLYLLKPGTSTARAKDILWRREVRKVGSNKQYVQPDSPTTADVLICQLSHFQGVEVVIYVDFLDEGKLTSPTPAQLAKLAIASVRDRKVENGLDGISYLIDAKCNGPQKLDHLIR